MGSEMANGETLTGSADGNPVRLQTCTDYSR
nr:MAG TPA: hypothetical protein [Caudoviricetes sp.]